MRWWPRSIRWQLLAGLLALELLSVGLFALLLFRQQTSELADRAQERIAYEARSLALQASEALEEQQFKGVDLSVRMMGHSPTVAQAKFTDAAGKTLFVSGNEAGESTLEPVEMQQIPLLRDNSVRCVTLAGNRWECVHAVYAGGKLRGFAWVSYDKLWMDEQVNSILRSTAIFGAIWIVASAILVLIMGRAIARPISVLHRGAVTLMNAPEDIGHFPLPVVVQNEIGDLIETFNRMVASLAEQRAGLNDTLSLLDSMLANAPIGLAFVDRNYRFVRVNRIFADLTGVAISRHLGRTLADLLPTGVAQDVEAAVEQVFSTEEPVRNLELSGESDTPRRPWTWLLSAYPVRTQPAQVRWAGVIALDASDRKRSEEALRRSEKLAVTGRLAASIAHEINNPLEAITNLLFLLEHLDGMPEGARQYVTMAEHETRRIAEITQQTLRFYRQPTQPARATLADLLDSVLSLYHGKLNSLGLRVERKYDPSLTIFCFAGEIRQVVANLIGNAIDASSTGGRLIVRARRSRDWSNPAQTGIRIVVADTGAGMGPGVREHIFEAFFTTKEATGTGLGLWVSHEIVLKHHGRVHVRSRAAAQTDGAAKGATGTVFDILIPDNPAFAQTVSAATTTKTPPVATA